MDHTLIPEVDRGLLLIRHGTTEDMEKGILSGHRQVGLSLVGWREAHELAMLLEGLAIRHLYASDLARAVQTASVFADRALLQTTPLLRERYGGSITGKYRTEVDWKNLPSDVETDASMLLRAAAVVERLPKSGLTVIVSHEGMNKALIATIMGCEMRDAARYPCVREPCGVSYFAPACIDVLFPAFEYAQ